MPHIYCVFFLDTDGPYWAPINVFIISLELNPIKKMGLTRFRENLFGLRTGRYELFSESH